MSLQNSFAPNYIEIIETCKEMLNEDDILEYLSEIASYDYKCPDKCNEWALNFYMENVFNR